MTLTAGQIVRVYPHGNPSQAAFGAVTIISGNQRSIAVAFGHLPPFAFGSMPLVGFHPQHGAMMIAMREAIDGIPWGPWIELASGGHYEIEPAREE